MIPDMKCFIASALDYKDVDIIYDRAIRPVLSKLKLLPLRVDRVEHNDDIDDKIFKLIDQSQILIADLTYARPSVYYEAGYAFGKGMPVIYLARGDHFRAQEADPAGILRVHFDLQMKNIIRWTKPNDAFKNRLRRRLKHVLKPILRERQESQLKKESERRFASLSQNDRLITLTKKGSFALHARGYKNGEDTHFFPLRNKPYYAHLEKKVGRTYRHVHIIARNTINKTSAGYPSWLWSSGSPNNGEKYTHIKSLCIFITLSSVKSSTLTTLFPNWTPVSNHRVFNDLNKFSTKEEIPHVAEITVIDGVKSLEYFIERFRGVVSQFEQG